MDVRYCCSFIVYSGARRASPNIRDSGNLKAARATCSDATEVLRHRFPRAEPNSLREWGGSTQMVGEGSKPTAAAWPGV